MKSASHNLPAWLLRALPVRIARQYASSYVQQSIQPDSIPRQLLVDVSVVYRSDARTGIQRVVRALLLQLLKSPPFGYCVRPVFATTKNGYCYADPNFLDPVSSASAAVGTAVVVKNGDLFLGLDLAAHLLPRHQRQVLSWKRSGVKVHVVVYDLLPLQYPAWFNDKTTRNFRRWIKWVAVYADSTICISNAVKTDLVAWFGANFNLPPTAVPSSTIVLGADISSSAPNGGVSPDAELLLNHLRGNPSVLMVGTLEPRKGHDQALAAFNLLWQRAKTSCLLLVIVGRSGWKTDHIQMLLREHPKLGTQLFWIEEASDELVERLYAASSGLLVASRAEGFGLTLIEAALHGKQVLARDISVFREINSPVVTYFEGNTAQALALAIESWQDKICRSSHAQFQANFHTWHNAATQLIEAIDPQNIANLLKYPENNVTSKALKSANNH
jgi:glycosyltransferase involved in cell wall biosynthesis